MAIIRSTENPFTFKPTGNTTVKPIFTRVTPPPPAGCYSYKIQSTEANLTQFGNGQLNTTVNVRYTACGDFPESPVVQLQRTGRPLGNSIEYAAYICSTTTPEVFSNLITVSPPDTNTNLCQTPIETTTTITTNVSPTSEFGSVNIINGAATGASGRIVTVRATPNANYRFVRWVIDGQESTSTSLTLDIVVDVDKNVTAIFEAAPAPTPTPTPSARSTEYVITLTTNIPNGGTIGFTTPQSAVGLTTYVGRVGESIPVNFSAQENTGYEFRGWWLNNQLWSTNRTPGILTNTSQTFEARFELVNQERLTCTCYFIAPTDNATSYQVRYRRCDTGQIVTETFTTFTNICSANIPEAISNGQVPLNLGTDCSTNFGICGSPLPSPTPSRVVQPPPAPTPSRTVITWRNCVTGELVEGTPPSGYVQTIFTGPAGGVCWEPPGDLAFLPSLAEVLRFSYQRGSSVYPTAKSVQVTNTSNSRARRVTIQTNPNVNLSTGTIAGNGSISFTVAPRGSVNLTVNVTPQLLQELTDGISTLSMNIQHQAV